MQVTHARFNRKVWAFKKDFVGSLAKWLIRQSPYTVPDNLHKCLEDFDTAIGNYFSFDTAGMCEIDLSTLTPVVSLLLESIPEIMLLNERKNGDTSHAFTSRRFNEPPNPDNDFIDILAVAQNITCDFATDAESDDYLNSCRAKKGA